MIAKQEIVALVAELQLQPHMVEKDYALGWFPAGIAAHPKIGPRWVFKGGTCLKKCYFETYRFSKDLDVTLQDAAHLDEAFLARVFEEISERRMRRAASVGGTQVRSLQESARNPVGPRARRVSRAVGSGRRPAAHQAGPRV